MKQGIDEAMATEIELILTLLNYKYVFSMLRM
jgi:hypothetical protein